MEAGNDSGQPSGESAKAEGGERAAGVSDGKASQGSSGFSTESTDPSRDYASCLHRDACRGIISGTSVELENVNLSFYFDSEKQVWKAASRTYRWASAALLIGLTLGLLLPLAYQMVSRG
jgi:hypothetical protein